MRQDFVLWQQAFGPASGAALSGPTAAVFSDYVTALACVSGELCDACGAPVGACRAMHLLPLATSKKCMTP